MASHWPPERLPVMEVSLSVAGCILIGAQLLSIRGITTALQLRLGGVMHIHRAIAEPNCGSAIQATYGIRATPSAGKRKTLAVRLCNSG